MKSDRTYFKFFIALCCYCCTTSNNNQIDVVNNEGDNVNTAIISLEELLSNSFIDKARCKNILLIKKNDCLGCEQIISRFFEDSSLIKQTLIISETVRKIEQKDYYKERPYLTRTKTIFNSDLIVQICKSNNIKFNTSVLIVLNEKNQIILKEHLKVLVGNTQMLQKVCQ